MKRYKDYMDGVEPSEELRERLLGLNAPKKRPAWAKYGAVAAALVLVAGLGVLGARYLGGEPELGVPEIAPVESSYPAQAVAPGDLPGGSEGTRTMGGYEVAQGEVMSYYMLPYIAYGESSGGVALSLVVPDGVTSRTLTQEEITAFFGGESALTTHLNWGGYTLSGYVMAYEDGTVWRAHLYGEKGNEAHFGLTVCPDELPLECCLAMGRAETITDVFGVQVAGYYGGIYGEGANREVWLPESREVEFLAHGVGCRFTFYGPEGESGMVEEQVSRFVRLAVTEGLELNALTPGWEPEAPYGGAVDPQPSQGPVEEQTEAFTPAYDPGASKSPEG